MRGQMEPGVLCSGFLEWNGAFMLSWLLEQTGHSSVLCQNPEARRILRERILVHPTEKRNLYQFKRI